MEMAVRGGDVIPWCDCERRLKTFAIRFWSSTGVNSDVIWSTSEAERIRRDIRGGMTQEKNQELRVRIRIRYFKFARYKSRAVERTGPIRISGKRSKAD